jgi:hypothetical protein
MATGVSAGGSISNKLANLFGKFGFLAKLQKTSSNNLAKGLGKLSSLAKVAPPGAYLRAIQHLASTVRVRAWPVHMQVMLTGECRWWYKCMVLCNR